MSPDSQTTSISLSDSPRPSGAASSSIATSGWSRKSERAIEKRHFCCHARARRTERDRSGSAPARLEALGATQHLAKPCAGRAIRTDWKAGRSSGWRSRVRLRPSREIVQAAKIYILTTLNYFEANGGT
jgi:hypothetical protein